MKDIILRDPVDFIMLLLALVGFTYWIVEGRKKQVNLSPVLIMVAGYIFYVMYRFAVIYSYLDTWVTDPAVRATLGL